MEASLNRMFHAILAAETERNEVLPSLLHLLVRMPQVLAVFGNLIRWAVLRPLLKPLTRILVGLIAIPLFRLVVRRGMRLSQVEEELEKDL